MKKLGILLAALVVAGCAETTAVTFMTAPQGALITLVDSGDELGRAPATINYRAEDLQQQDAEGCYLLEGVRAEWASGASAQINQLRFCDLQDGYYYVDLERPANYPNAEVDLQYEQQYLQERAMRLASQGFEDNPNNVQRMGITRGAGGRLDN
ncbi:MAG: hypothetical protein RL120_08060 [Gammaproteobacteria bacterium]